MMRKKIMALHGNLGSTEDWKFLENDELFAIDLWDHSGKSFQEMATYLADLAGEERPTLLGYSLGGRIVLDQLTRYPGKWSGAVVLSAHPGLSCKEERMARQISDQIWADRARELEWSEFLKMWDKQRVLHGDVKPTGREMLVGRKEQIALAFENWSLGRQDDLREAIARNELPILWLTGENDEKFSAIGWEMETLSPHIHHRVVPACGHRIPFEDPETVSRLIYEFQDRLID